MHSSSPTQQPLVSKYFYAQSNQIPITNSLGLTYGVCRAKTVQHSISYWIDVIGKP